MKKMINITFILSFFFGTNAFSASAEHCISLDHVWGSKCGSSDSLQIRVKNMCAQSVYIKMCLEEEDGGWSCGTDSSFDPNQTKGGFFTCHATGSYEWAACTGGFNECGFSDPR